MRRAGRMRLAVAAVMLASATSGSSVARAAAVQGGGSFDDAPTLRPGVHTDTILPRETLFYAVALGEGQRVRVEAVVDLSMGSKSNSQGIPDALGGFRLTLYSPLRERLPSAHAGEAIPGAPDLQTDGFTLQGTRVTSAAAADRGAADGDDWTGPGIFHFTAAISATFGDLGAVVEFPLRLKVTVDGPPLPASRTATGPLGRPGLEQVADRPARPSSRGSDSETGRSELVLVVGGGGGLLAGLVLGFVVAGRRSPGVYVNGM